MTDDKNRCLVTGLGVICAIGNNVEETWKNALNSVSGIHKTTSVDTKDCYADLAAEVSCDNLDENIENPDEKDRATKFCIRAAKEALKDAGLTKFNDDPRVSVIMGSCVGGVASIEKYYNDGQKDVSQIAKMPIGAIASNVAEETGAAGLVTNIGNACAAGTMSISVACDLIRAGKADVVIAGGADSFASVPYSGFLALHALDENGCSPFNHCHGITLGEGSGVVIVESYEHAKARGAKSYCEVLGGAVTQDAHHITAPREDGLCQIEAIERAIKKSGIKKSDIGYVNAHGTGTGKNDGAEFLSLHAVFDKENPTVSASSTKALTGHCLGAAGSIEAVFSIKALTENTVLPTLGFSEEDKVALKEKAGTLDFAQNVPHAKELTAVMSNNFAFGGTDASIIYSKIPGDVSSQSAKDKAVCVTGFGIVSPLGNTKEAYIEAVKNNVKVSEANLHSSVGLDDYNANGLKMAFTRKLDNMSQLMAVSGVQALKDAGITVGPENEKDIGIIIGTSEGALGPTYEFQELISKEGNAKGSAFKFPHTVYNAAGGYLSITTGVKGYGATVTQGPSSGLTSIAYGLNLLRDGQEKVIMAAGLDENTEVLTDLYKKMGYLADKAVGPYDEADGFVMSDGAVSMMMEEEDYAKARGGKIYCHVLGYGNGRKNVKFGKLESSGSALDAAIKDALKDANTSPDEITAIFGFADGCKAVDDIEISSYKNVFGEKFASIPLVEVKERCGEGRAASATLQASHAAMMLGGLIESDTAYRFTADGLKREKLSSSDLGKVLVTSFSSGGSYVAVVLGK